MTTQPDLRRSRLTTPHAAAIAGIVFSVLLITSLVLVVFPSQPIRMMQGRRLPEVRGPSIWR